jgi:hypothetical protein
MTPQEMRVYLESVPDRGTDSPMTEQEYENAVRRAGRDILHWLESHPDDREKDFWELEIPALHGHDYTGYMVGWGLNAAQYVLGIPKTPNPAIFDIRVSGE